MKQVSEKQIPLGIKVRDDATFDNFFAGSNEMAVQSLKQQLSKQGERFIYLWGQRGTGCSHLLQAACHLADHLRLTSVYLPLDELVEYGPEMLEGLDQMDLIAFDNVQAIHDRQDWQEALFHLFNRVRDDQRHILIAGDNTPQALGFTLKDLESRLTWGLTYQIQTLSDEEKIAALQLRAQVRGLELSEDVGRYILSRSGREMKELYAVLDRLDEASLQAQRKLTKPFVKSVFEW